MIKSQIIKHSVNPYGQELVTYELTYPRMVHSEFLTHRAFSRNASSSRAIPIRKMIQQVWNNPACPERWGSNGKGMQDHGNMTGWRLKLAKAAWIAASKLACCTAWLLEQCGVHKQISNRCLEPWAHITVVMTTALPGLLNFFSLRAHKDAQPEFQVLAYKMLRDYLLSTPDKLDWGQWHLPYGQGTDLLTDKDKLKVCTGRLARVSYLTHDGKRDMQKDQELHDQLATSGHFSPFEHCAMASLGGSAGGNFGAGWHQYRKDLPLECRGGSRQDLEDRFAQRPDWVNYILTADTWERTGV